MAKKNTNPLFIAVQDELNEREREKDEKPIKKRSKKDEEKTATPVTTIQVTKTTHLKLKLLASKSNNTFEEYLSNMLDNVIKKHPDKEKLLSYIELTSEIF